MPNLYPIKININTTVIFLGHQLKGTVMMQINSIAIFLHPITQSLFFNIEKWKELLFWPILTMSEILASPHNLCRCFYFQAAA